MLAKEGIRIPWQISRLGNQIIAAGTRVIALQMSLIHKAWETGGEAP